MKKLLLGGLLAVAGLGTLTLIFLPEIIWRLRLAVAQPDPRKVQLVTKDISRFWCDYALAARDTTHAVQIFQRAYF